MIRSLEWMTTNEAAKLFDCTVQHVRLLIRTGKIVGSKRGRDWFVQSDSAKDYKSERYPSKPKMRPALARTQGRLFEDPGLHPVVNVSSVPQRSPFRYPGGKTWLIPEIRSWLSSLSGKPSVLVEPFAGGGGVSLTAAFENLVGESLLVEMDPDVASVWRTILSEDASELASRIRSFECTEPRVREALSINAPDDLGRAFLTILRNRVSRGGILAPGAGLVKNGEANKGIASRWYPETLARRIEDIYAHRENLRCVEGDGLEILESYAQCASTAYFIDPPYPVAGKRLYRFHQLDHRRLFEIMATLQGPFLATYDHNPEIQALAVEFGFDHKLIPMKSTHHARKYELLISRDLNWLRSGVALASPSSD